MTMTEREHRHRKAHAAWVAAGRPGATPPEPHAPDCWCARPTCTAPKPSREQIIARRDALMAARPQPAGQITLDLGATA